jgi:hypothetical protein
MKIKKYTRYVMLCIIFACLCSCHNLKEELDFEEEPEPKPSTSIVAYWASHEKWGHEVIVFLIPTEDRLLIPGSFKYFVYRGHYAYWDNDDVGVGTPSLLLSFGGGMTEEISGTRGGDRKTYIHLIPSRDCVAFKLNSIKGEKEEGGKLFDYSFILNFYRHDSAKDSFEARCEVIECKNIKNITGEHRQIIDWNLAFESENSKTFYGIDRKLIKEVL